MHTDLGSILCRLYGEQKVSAHVYLVKLFILHLRACLVTDTAIAEA